MSPPHIPSHGEVWFADLGSPIGHEQGGVRPVVILTGRRFSSGSTLAVVCPLTSREKNISTRVRVGKNSFALVDQIRTISILRLKNRSDDIPAKPFIELKKAIVSLLGLDQGAPKQ